MRSLVQYLEEIGELVPTQTTTSERLVGDYRQYLNRDRGFSAATITRHAATVTTFLRFLDHDVCLQQLHDLRLVDVEAFVLKVGKNGGRDWLAHVTAVLRRFLRFLAATGEGPAGIDAQVGSPRIYRGERLPRALPWETVRTFLLSIDRTTIKGRRDYAIFLLIATYGLRASEVCALRLDDIAWRTCQISVPRPKVGTPLLLPLTDEVGSALLEYLRGGRPESTHRHLFLRVEFPIAPLGKGVIPAAFRAWARRAEISLPARFGAHCIRHALAMHLLREGASLKMIGDLLGHRSAESTGVYLRLDVADLRNVALPLPSGAKPAEVQP